MVLMKRAVHVGYWVSMHNVQRTQITSIQSTVKLIFNNFVGEYLARGLLSFHVIWSISKTCCSFSVRVYNRGGDVIGRYDIPVCEEDVIVFVWRCSRHTLVRSILPFP